jgi:hypothetical protein
MKFLLNPDPPKLVLMTMMGFWASSYWWVTHHSQAAATAEVSALEDFVPCYGDHIRHA